jgi:NTP pyrophosphatase (non-canonical NTP hydrolase)
MKDLALDHWDQLLDLVCHENNNQLGKWGYQDHDQATWLMFLTEEVGELSQAISEFTFRGGPRDDIISEAIQVATLALKMAEMNLDWVRSEAVCICSNPGQGTNGDCPHCYPNGPFGDEDDGCQ